MYNHYLLTFIRDLESSLGRNNCEYFSFYVNNDVFIAKIVIVNLFIADKANKDWFQLFSIKTIKSFFPTPHVLKS